MAEAPKVQRQRRRRRNNNNITSAAPTADATPSGVSTTTAPRAPRRRRRSRRVRFVNRPLIENDVFSGRRRFPRRFITRAVKREIKREGLEGPKVSVQQKITSTFGMIGPNTTDNAELELNFFLHPALAKEANDGTAFGPLQALAAQYSLWKIKYLTLRFTPMVGASAVSGTVVRASLNLSQSPGGSNWSGLGTRLHIDMHPGQVATFHLRGDQVGGPRDGGWWFTDTNEEGSQSAGPIVEVHTLGATKSTFKDDDWKGPLFLVEGIGLWQFANYQVKPALGSLERKEGDAQVNLEVSVGQPIAMTMESTNDVAMFMDRLEPEMANPLATRATADKPSVGETIFQIVDVGAQLAQSFAPPPFSWLIKGGWWFVKKVLGVSRSGKSRYLIYASLQDAQNNKPAVATGSLSAVATAPTTKLMVTQINSPNVGPSPATPGSTRFAPQILSPGDSFRVSSRMLTELFIRTKPSASGSPAVSVPVATIPGVLRTNTGGLIPYATISSGDTSSVSFIQTPWWIGVPGQAPSFSTSSSGNDTTYIPGQFADIVRGGYVHTLYRLIDPRFTDQSGNYEYFDPPPQDISLNFCAMNNFCGCDDASATCPDGTPLTTTGTGKLSGSNPYAVYGKVVGTRKFFSGTTPTLDIILSLIKITKQYSLDQDCVRDMVMVFGDTANTIRVIPMPNPKPPQTSSNVATPWPIWEREIPEGAYLLGVSYTNAPMVVQGADIPTTLKMGSYERVESASAPIMPYNLSGQTLPATSVDVMLQYVEYHPPSEDLIKQLTTLGVSFNAPLPPIEEVPEEGFSEGEEPALSISSSDSESDADSVERFLFEIGNEMIELPKRWLNDPDFSKYLE
ncbi:capsid protein precursor [Mamastrovirus 18]|uniref:Capsid protein n=1 Tax=Mamastrovirus 18 TaxID=1239582 RepID=B5AFP5_9VIRU|nr:capsid protein precursor [Mamastrovirus 18]ACF75865.1 capsid protein precursor [Mamastrovirus 18]